MSVDQKNEEEEEEDKDEEYAYLGNEWLNPNNINIPLNRRSGDPTLTNTSKQKPLKYRNKHLLR